MPNLTSVTVTSGVPTAGTGTVSTLDNLIGTAGTASAQVLSVQGIASATAVKVDGSAVTQPVSLASVPSHAVTNAGTFAVQVSSAPTTAVTIATAPVLVTGSAVIGKVGIDQTTDGTTNAVHLTSGTNTIGKANVLLNGTTPDVGSGTGGSATQRVLVDTSQLGSLGPATAANSVSVVPVDQYATHKEVAASQTATVLGATGAIGDYLSHIIVFPGTAGCGVVTILDASSTVGTFVGGGTTALPSLVPFMIPIGAFCTGAGWKITTGANVTVMAVGKFT